ncbi:MAG: NADH-quinone oxidoreductase subunit C [Planctomycetota bacterium]|nr:NADH-quinone oxidoreductase subunit C [Planctomycetota bacterium]
MSIFDTLKSKLGDGVEEVVDEGTHPFVRVKAASIVDAARALREDGVEMLHQVSGVDFAEHMEVVYHFARLKPAEFICLKVSVPRDNPVVPTLANEWGTADWGERETWDLLGIRFEGHPHHYRVLLPEDWEGHPLRKDYQFPMDYHGIDCVE